MEISSYISVGISCLGLLGGLVSWSLNLKIKHDLLENNEKLEKKIYELKETFTRELTAANNNYVRELSAVKDKLSDRIEHIDRDLTELKSNLPDRILSIVNGKYVRTDLHQQTIASIHERFVSFKQLIEVNMEKIDQGLERQILDLKERIFHPNSTTK
jgi:seryl-tRNA synthetase